jgi:hypothetical protein
VERTACQRLVHSVSRPYPGPEVLGTLPGLKALRAISSAAKKVKPPVAAGLLTDVEGAIDRLESMIGELAGSRSHLSKRLAVTRAVPRIGGALGAEAAQAREQLFDSAAKLTGRYSETWVAVYLYWPDEKRKELMRDVRAHGLVGHVARPSAVPITFHNFSSERDEADMGENAFRPLEESVGGDPVPAAVLQEFSSKPAPVMMTSQPNELLVASVVDDPKSVGGGTGRPLDLILGLRSVSKHPLTRDVPLEEVWGLINFPVRRILFDVYLHRDLARACIPSLDVHLWRPDFVDDIGDRWSTRFSSGPRLQLLGPGVGNADSDAHARHAELTAYLFEKAGHDAEGFVGFRCDEAYPLWRCGYCMSFDFGGERSA